MKDKPLLTECQRRVMGLVIRGRTNKEIGQALGISPFTVHHHVSAICQRLGVNDRTAAAVKWIAPEVFEDYDSG